MKEIPPDHAEREADALSVLRRCSAILGRATTAGDVARAIVREVTPALGGLGVSVFERDDEALRLMIADGYPTEVLDRYAAIPLEAPLPPTDSVRAAEPILLRDIADAPPAVPRPRDGGGVRRERRTRSRVGARPSPPSSSPPGAARAHGCRSRASTAR